MPKLAANLSMMYTELPFLERFAAAAEDGFTGVEFLFPYAFEARAIRAELDRHGLQQVLFNTPPGDFDAGERGIAALPGREEEFRRGIDLAIDYAQHLRCPQVHLMAGLVKSETERGHMREVYQENLRYAAGKLASAGLRGLIEPINTRDIPGYLLNTQEDAHDLLARLSQPNLAVQMDFYHVQIVQGDIAMRLRRFLPGVGHVQIAGVPHRHEPDLGEVHYPYLLRLLDELGYSGWVGCEYRPQNGTRAGLAWAKPWLSKGVK
jgi:2-dehydrotetronate isomerase